MTERLRPIGTEFSIEYPPCENSTDPRGTLIHWRVKAHRLVDRFPGWPVFGQVMSEEWEAISYEMVEQP